MKTFKQIPEDAEYREVYDSYRLTVDNLNDEDFLYKSMLSNGQLYFANDEVYGFVNNQAAIRNRNLVITKDYIDNFVIRDFILYNRLENNTITLNINCNLKDYRDGKPHYLYVVLSNKGKYEVYDDMFQSDETKILFARFIIDELGNSIQFYMMLPFAGSADYLKGNQFYQVTDGLRVEVVNKTTKQLTLTDAKIRFSAINFDDVSSPDCLEVNFDGAVVPIRYITWDSDDKIPRVDWVNDTVDTLVKDKIMNYSTGKVSSIEEGKFSIQKLYYDVYEKCIIALYGNKEYSSREEAIYGIDSIMDYPLPDGIEYLIPIAGIISCNTDDAYSDENFKIVNLDYNEKEVLDSDTFTRQQSAEAVKKARQALDETATLANSLQDHVGNLTNPHKVRLDQLYNSEGNQIKIDDSYADYSVSSILSQAAASAAEIYYKKTGGQISGNVSISGILGVSGESTLDGNVTIGGTTTVKKDILPSGTVNIGSNSARLNYIYGSALNISGDATLSGTSVTHAVRPSTTTSYDLGTSSYRYNTVYTKDLNASGAGSISGNLSVSGSITANGGTFNGNVSMGSSKRFDVNNGYLIVGGCALCLNSRPSGLPVSTGFSLS